MRVFTLPFRLDRDEMRGHDAAHGVDGIVSLEEDTILLTYTLRLATVGGAQVKVEETPERLSESLDVDVAAHDQSLIVPFSHVRDVQMSGGILRSPRLLLRVNDERVLDPLPWSDGLTCMMRMRRSHGQALRLWLTEAELRLARARLGSQVGR